jgi:predicted class III extradiol MEMO1 family dioxygenase
MHRNAIDCEVLTGTERNKRILIPRINLTYSGTILPFNFQRSQFAIIAVILIFPGRHYTYYIFN